MRTTSSPSSFLPSLRLNMSGIELLLDFWGLEEWEVNKVILDTAYIPNVAQRCGSLNHRDKFDTVSHLTTADTDDVDDLHEAMEQHNRSDLEVGYMSSGKINREIIGSVCKACAHCNEMGLHWCAECGSAITGTTDCSSTQSPSHSAVVKSFTTRIHSSTDVPSQSSQSLSLPSISKPNMLTKYPHKSNRIQSSIKYNTQACTSSTRHWDTSGVYMWRKQSTQKPILNPSTKYGIARCCSNEETTVLVSVHCNCRGFFHIILSLLANDVNPLITSVVSAN